MFGCGLVVFGRAHVYGAGDFCFGWCRVYDGCIRIVFFIWGVGV